MCIQEASVCVGGVTTKTMNIITEGTNHNDSVLVGIVRALTKKKKHFSSM